MTGNRRLFTSYKAYDDGHVVFGRNLKGKVVGGGNITHDSITITNVDHVSGLAFNLIRVGQICNDDCVVIFSKVDCTISKNGKMVAKCHRRNGLHTCKLGDNSKQKNCLESMMDNSTLWHRRLGHANIGSQGNANNRTRIEVSTTKESLNVTFDESLPEPKSSPSVIDDRINEPVVQDLNGSPSLQVNVMDEGYLESIREARGHPIEQVIGELNERILRIMPPRRFKKKSVKRLVEKHVAKAIEEYEKNRANLDSAGSSGGNPGNAGGTMNGSVNANHGFHGLKLLRRMNDYGILAQRLEIHKDAVSQSSETVDSFERRDNI
ncbi:hypothetical protein Tco_1483398 [Tanacetum coccineum]